MSIGEGHWIRAGRGFLFHVQALSKVFRGKLLAALTRTFDTGGIKLRAHRRTSRTRTRAGRLVSFQRDQVSFRYKDYAHGNRRLQRGGSNTRRGRA